MYRAVPNVTGDLLTSILVDRSEGFPAGTGLINADFREPASQVAPVLTGSGPLA